MKDEKEELIVKELSEKIKKKEKILKCMITILKKEKYELDEMSEIIVDFFTAKNF